jgi:hypothetical protein
MIIGLIGFKQVGKSTAAKYLAEHGFARINMKDALVAELRNNFPDLLQAIANNETDWEGEIGMGKTVTVDDLFELKPPIMRALMQNYGTEVRRADKDSYWTDQWEDAASKSEIRNIVVDDVRFINEAEAVRHQGGILIRLVRPDITSGGTHSSETEQLQIVADHTIECKPGEHETLYKSLDEIIYTHNNLS